MTLDPTKPIVFIIELDRPREHMPWSNLDPSMIKNIYLTNEPVFPITNLYGTSWYWCRVDKMLEVLDRWSIT